MLCNIAVFLHSRPATDSRESLPSNQPSVQTTVQSDNGQSQLTITSSSERRVKTIPISKTRIQQKQRQEQLPRHQYLHKDIGSENKSIMNIMTKKEIISRQNLKHVGRGPQSLALYKKRHLTQDPVLIQARQGLNKTVKTGNPGSRLLSDRAKLNQALLKMQKDKDVCGGEMSQSKPHMKNSEAGNQASGLTSRLPSSSSPDKPSSEFPKDHKLLVFPKQSNIVASSSSSKALNCDPETHTSGKFTVDSQKLKCKGPADDYENSNSSSLELNTSNTENLQSTHHSKPQFTASETNTCISTLSQTKQTDCFRFPLKSHGSSAESSHLARICRPESETTTSNYIYTPRQLNHSDKLPLKGRTCRRVIKGAGSFSDRKSMCLMSTQARKKDLSSQETGRRWSQKKDFSKPSQKNHHGSDTDSSKSISSRTSSLEEDTHLKKHKRLEVQIKCSKSCSTQSTNTHTSRDMRDDTVIQTTFPGDLYSHPNLQTHRAIPELSMADRMPQTGADQACEQSLGEEYRLTVEQVNFAKLHQQDDSLPRKPSVSEARKSKQEIIPLPAIYAFTRKYKPNDF